MSTQQEPTAPTESQVINTPVEQPALSGDLKTLKDAFPDLDIEIIEAILASQGGSVDAAFEVLLGMSDPTFKPDQSEEQLRQDEEYARRLAREGDAHLPQNTNPNTNENQQPLFNFQEELPVIKEKVIEAGTAAKNKIMSLYNQFMAGPSDQQQQQQQRSDNGLLETGVGNLSLSDNDYPGRQQQQQQQQYNPRNVQRGSVDLYEWDGREESNNNIPRKKSVTSTTAEQLLSDEEYARRLAREDADLAEAIAISSAAANAPTTLPVVQELTQPTLTTTTTTSDAGHKDSDNEEVTFSAVESDKKTKVADVEDDLDDLFDKNDSNLDILEDIEDSEEEKEKDKDKDQEKTKK